MMSTIETQAIIERLQTGRLIAAEGADFESLPMQAFIQELRRLYPVVFQERRIRSKYEIGLAATMTYQLALKSSVNSIFPSARVYATFRKCLLISGYGDSISEITSARNIGVYPRLRPMKGLIVRMGPGFKFDKTPDGWKLTPLEKKTTSLSEELLRSRGWGFDVTLPLRQQP